MHTNRSALGRVFRKKNWRLALFPVLAAAAAFSFACEDKGIGRPCDLEASSDPTQALYNAHASECPSHLCVKPALQAGVASDLDTGPYCTATCNSDSDCDGQSRDATNPNDKRCIKGYSCAITFGKGKTEKENAPQDLCCVKICLCRDFFNQAYGAAVPDECKDRKNACE